MFNSIQSRKNKQMKTLLMGFTVIIFSLAVLVYGCNAQSAEKPKTEEKSPGLSIFHPDKGTTNAEAEKLRNRGIEFAVKLENDRAIAEFTKAIKLDPKYADAYSRRGAAYSNNKDNDSAIADFTKAIELDPKFDLAYMNRGASYVVKKEYKLAIADFTKAIEIGDNIEMAYIMRADAYEKIGRKDLADADNKKLRELMAKPKQ
ncbi:MAG: tetratricopeptide repeat protein [Chloracidobacterium sp.]|nr:tetratricopeptide repeat protein [Chloracidobacterium sp.]